MQGPVQGLSGKPHLPKQPPGQCLLTQGPRHRPSQGPCPLSRPLGTPRVCPAASDPGREGEASLCPGSPSKHRHQSPSFVSASPRAAALPSQFLMQLNTCFKWKVKMGFLSFAPYLLIANDDALDLPSAGLPLLQFPSSLVLPGEQVMRNQKQDFKYEFDQINATRNLSGPSEGNEACDMKISSENSNPPK